MTGLVGAFVLTAGFVAQATGGRLVAGSPERPFTSASADSRALEPGSLFIALRGPRFDGHAFVTGAADRGAAGAILADPAAIAAARARDLAVIESGDTLRALQDLAREVRRRSGARVVAITGSAGKTTTKEVTAGFLSARYRVYKNAGNLNNHVGLPLSLLGLCSGPEIAVVELGMNRPGEIRALCQIAEPDVRVWTNVGDAHLGGFTSLEELARAKAELLDDAPAGTLAILNADDPLVMAHRSRFSGRVVTFGEHEGADLRAMGVVDRGFEGTTADVVWAHGRAPLSVPLAGRAHLSNVLAAAATALELGVPWPDIASRASQLQPVPRRGTVVRVPGGATLIDDSYNASPAAMRAMLAAFAATPGAHRRVAVLGEMLELGESSRALHDACGRAAAAAHVTELVVIGGPAADGLADGAVAGGLGKAHVHRFDDSASAAEAIGRIVRAGDLVLVKGSRGTRTDVVADRIARDGVVG